MAKLIYALKLFLSLEMEKVMDHSFAKKTVKDSYGRIVIENLT